MKKIGSNFSKYTDRASTKGGTRKYALEVLYEKNKKIKKRNS